MDKASLLDDAKTYIQDLQRKLEETESQIMELQNDGRGSSKKPLELPVPIITLTTTNSEKGLQSNLKMSTKATADYGTGSCDSAELLKGHIYNCQCNFGFARPRFGGSTLKHICSGEYNTTHFDC
jgi:hypothetical protein